MNIVSNKIVLFGCSIVGILCLIIFFYLLVLLKNQIAINFRPISEQVQFTELVYQHKIYYLGTSFPRLTVLS